MCVPVYMISMYACIIYLYIICMCVYSFTLIIFDRFEMQFQQMQKILQSDKEQEYECPNCRQVQ